MTQFVTMNIFLYLKLYTCFDMTQFVTRNHNLIVTPITGVTTASQNSTADIPEQSCSPFNGVAIGRMEPLEI